MSVLKSPFAQLMEYKFRDWQVEQIQKGERRTSLTAFAEYLGFPQATVSYWMNGQNTPSHENTAILGSKLGYEIYDALSINRPDPLWAKFEVLFYHLDDEQKQHILKQAEEYALNNINPRRTANSET